MSTREERRGLGWAWVVVVLFAASGAVHLLRPGVFDAQVPDFLPARTAVVVVSGVAELVLAAGMVWPRTRRRAAAGAAVLLVLVFPGNLWQAWEAWRDWQAGDATGGYLAGTLLRLPLQVPLVLWCWRAGRPLSERETGYAAAPPPR